MEHNTIFWVIIGVLLFGYLLEQWLDRLNLKYTVPEFPKELTGIFEEEEYRKSQAYKRDNTRFSFFSSTFSLLLMLLMFFLGGFGWLDSCSE